MNLWPALVALNIVALAIFDLEVGAILVCFIVALALALFGLERVIGKK